MDILNEVGKEQMRTDLPEFGVGDTVRVDYKITEGAKERIQAFQGIVIQKRGNDVSKTFTVRKVSNGVAVERIFPMSTPLIAKLEVLRYGKVRRSKLFYLREAKGRRAKIKEKRKY